MFPFDVDLSTRVAQRYVLAGFIPDKFWREQKQKLKAVLTKKAGSLGSVGYALRNELVAFYRKFEADLIELSGPAAEATIRDRVDNVIYVINKVAQSLDKLEEEIGGSYIWPTHTAEEEVTWSVATDIKSAIEAKVQTPGDAMKGMYGVDRRLIKALAQRLLKKATPEEVQAIEATTGMNDAYYASRTKHAFYDRVGLTKQAVKLINREVVRYDPIKWLDFLREVLITNYTDPKSIEYQQFDLHGMKVVVDDSTVTDDDIRAYVKHLDKAYYLLKSKGLQKVWYGTVFIRCRGCGGVNYNTGGGVGGNYPIGPDVVNVFERPSDFIVELMLHELGHRYWFKLMNESQRARFNSLVKVRHAPKPQRVEPKLIEVGKADEAKSAVDAKLDEVVKALGAFKTAMLRAKRVTDGIRKNSEGILEPASRDMVDAFINAFYKTTTSADDPATKALFNDALDAAGAVRTKFWDASRDLQRALNAEPDPTGPVPNVDRFWLDVLRKVLPPWLAEATKLIEAARAAAYVYIDTVIRTHNENESLRNERILKEWQDREDADTRPVTPVSDYGKSNIDEAFAEAFAHYVGEFRMNQDQIESFRSVLKTATQRVTERFLRTL